MIVKQSVNNRKHICIVSRCSWTLYNFRYNLISKLLEEGYEVTTVGFDKSGFAAKLAELPINHVCLGPLNSSNKKYYSQLKYILKLFFLFTAHRPHFVHFFTMQPVLIGPIAARLLWVNYAVTITGLGHLFQYEHRRPSFLIRTLMRNSTSNASFCIFQNNYDVSFLQGKGCLPNKAAIEIVRGSGVDTNLFKTIRQNKPREKTNFLMVGRLIGEKGIEEYFASVEGLGKEYKSKANFYLAGDVDEYNPTSFSISQVQARCSQSGVIYLGHTDNIVALLRNNDVLVLPSYREGLSKALLEGGAMSMALIATDVPGCNDIVKHDETGLLVKLKSCASLKSAFEIYLTDSKKLYRHGQEARKMVVEKFSDKIILSQIVDLYSKVLSNEKSFRVR